ncbi:MAG: hypothetical protein M1829_000321 [Trizodia sp. TS-e1964]|nr:MAG: hypothetical protein M1829_000321 [Trizodia sp. TS-e1964]
MQSSSSSPLSYDPTPASYPLEGEGPSQGFLPLSPTTISFNQHRQRFPKPIMPPTVKRSASSPNVRAHALVDALGVSYPSDRRRNKLGYHRTSVACVHCRRRKIRCLLAPEDLDGRCSNCIRLKKECNFFPVDQQPSLPERRHRADSRPEFSPRGTPTSPPSGPSVYSKPTEEPGDITHSYPPIPSNSPHNYLPPGDVRLRLASISTGKETVPSLPRTYHWETNGQLEQAPSESKSNTEEAVGSFWRVSESPMTPLFSPFSGPPGFGHLPPRASGGSFSIEGGSEDIAWPMPGRSMSYGQLEGLPSGYPTPYQPVPHDHQTPPNGPAYRPQPNTTASLTSVSEPVSASADGPRPYGIPPMWSPSYIAPPYSGVSNPPSAGYAWYPEPGPLAQVKEETSAALSEEPAAYYSSAPQTTSS